MKTINYKLSNGWAVNNDKADGAIQVEVSDETATLLAQWKTDDETQNRYERSRNTKSLDLMLEFGEDYEDRTLDIERLFIASETLDEILAVLSEGQQKLFTAFYIEGKKQKDIALELGVSKQAINKQLNWLHKKIKNFYR